MRDHARDGRYHQEGMGMTPVCVAIYARVSSEQQATSNTIDSQIAALEARLAQDGLALIPEGCFTDEGYSGATLMRPALERLRDAAAAGNLDRLYVHSPDRPARRYAYQVLLIDEFHRAGVEVVFLNRPIGLSPEDDLLLQVQGMVAEYARAKILERSRRGQRAVGRTLWVSLCREARWRGGPLRDPGGRGSDRAADLCVDRPRAHQPRRGVPASPAGGHPDPQRQAGLGSVHRVGHSPEPRLCGNGGLRQDPDRAHAGPVAPGAWRQRAAPPGPRGLRRGARRVDQRASPAAGR